MEYIAYKEFKGIAICGYIIILKDSVLICSDNVLNYNENLICAATSENAHTYFMRNDDGNGIRRGDLITEIKSLLSASVVGMELSGKRWQAVYTDPICQKYKRPEHSAWLWNHDFYNADIEDLEHIINIIKEVKYNDESE